MDDRSKAGLRGPVRTCRTEHISNVGDQKNSAATRYWNEVQYLPDGRLAGTRSHSPNGSESQTTFTYTDDSQGRLRERACWQGKTSCGSTLYRYDQEGRLERVIQRSPQGEEAVSETYTYDERGRKNMTQYFPGLPDLRHLGGGRAVMNFFADTTEGFAWQAHARSLSTSYDDQDRELDSIGHDAEHKPVLKILRRYDEDGQLAEVSTVALQSAYPKELADMLSSAPPGERQRAETAFGQIFGAGATLHRVTYRYDEQGRVIETASFLGPLPAERELKTYNDHGDEATITSESPGQDFAINESGELIEPEPKRPPHLGEARFEYVYDERGNWIERKSLSESGSPDAPFRVESLEKREITYC